MDEALRERFEAELGRIVTRLRDSYRPERVLVFGSCARGEVHEDSDLDLIVIKHTTKRPSERAVEARLALDTDYAVDVLVFTPEEIAERTASGDPVLREILAEA
ncbi:MAG: nucleotidyltransferase domain-containing protein, partial [Myxococcota bacterium]